MSIHHTQRVSSPVDDVEELLCSERFNVEIQQGREDVVEARYEPRGDDDAERRWDMHVTCFGRKLTGGFDRSRTEQSVTRYRFERETRALHWRHIGQHAERVDVHGVTRLVPDGDGSRIEREVTIRVNIPLIGKGIARIVEAEFEKGLGPLAAHIERMLEESAP